MQYAFFITYHSSSSVTFFNFGSVVFFKLIMLKTENCRYMKQRLTLEKVNAAINDMSTYAETNKQLIKAPRKKVLLFTVIILDANIYRPFRLMLLSFSFLQ